MTAAASVVDLWCTGDLEPLRALLADGVTFSSPVADYQGRDDAAHLLGLIPKVVSDITRTDVALAGDLRFTGLTARIGERELEGVVRERHDGEGRLVHVTLFLRPFRSLTSAIKVMGRQLEELPLPSRRA